MVTVRPSSRMQVVPCLLACMLVLAIPTATASGFPAEGQVALEGEARLAGRGELRAHDGTLDLAPALHAGEALALSFSSAKGHRISTNWTSLYVDALPQPVRRGEQPVNETWNVGPGRLSDLACGRGCMAFLLGTPEGVVGLSGRFDGALPRVAEPRSHVADFKSGADTFHHEIAKGDFQAGGPKGLPVLEARPLAEGRVVLFLMYGEGLMLADGKERRVDARAYSEELASTDGTGRLVRSASSWIYLELEDARIEAPAGSQAVAYAKAPRVSFDGVLDIARASGALALSGEPHAIQGAPLRLEGALDVTFRGAPDGATVADFGGDVRAAAAGSAPLAPRLSATEATLLAMLGAGLLGLVGWMAQRGTGAVLYTRISRAAALDNPRRRAVYEAIRAEPGATAAVAARATGLHRVLVQYHLRMLESSGFLVTRQDGRMRRYFPVEAARSYADLALERALREDSRRRLAEAVRAAPQGLTQRELAAMAGLSLRLVSYHMAHLVEAGLVAQQAGRPKRYLATDTLSGWSPPRGEA